MPSPQVVCSSRSVDSPLRHRNRAVFVRSAGRPPTSMSTAAASQTAALGEVIPALSARGAGGESSGADRRSIGLRRRAVEPTMPHRASLTPGDPWVLASRSFRIRQLPHRRSAHWWNQSLLPRGVRSKGQSTRAPYTPVSQSQTGLGGSTRSTDPDRNVSGPWGFDYVPEGMRFTPLTQCHVVNIRRERALRRGGRGGGGGWPPSIRKIQSDGRRDDDFGRRTQFPTMGFAQFSNQVLQSVGAF